MSKQPVFDKLSFKNTLFVLNVEETEKIGIQEGRREGKKRACKPHDYSQWPSYNMATTPTSQLASNCNAALKKYRTFIASC